MHDLGEYKFGLKHACQPYLFCEPICKSVGTCEILIIWKYLDMRFSLEMVLGLNRNKRGLKRFSFGLVEIL